MCHSHRHSHYRKYFVKQYLWWANDFSISQILYFLFPLKFRIHAWLFHMYFVFINISVQYKINELEHETFANIGEWRYFISIMIYACNKSQYSKFNIMCNDCITHAVLLNISPYNDDIPKLFAAAKKKTMEPQCCLLEL